MAQHISLYRKYRPDTWEKVIGQKHIVTTLVNQIKTGSLTHAYLFTGTRGTGKTSSAKIFAKALNCLSPENGSPCNKCKVCLSLSEESNLDVIEMDAASNNSVDDIRDLREKIQFPPAIAKYKVYIIDEVHMLSGSAFNALLKTLEEPPSHAIFILATTEVNKLPSTILSRCMRFDFRLVPVTELVDHLAKIFEMENYKFDKKALEQIAIHGEGSVRDTLSLADMCMSYAPLKLRLEDVLEVLGSSETSTLYDLAKAILTSDIGKILEITSTVYSRGKGIEIFNKELSEYLRELISIKNIRDYKNSFSEIDRKNAEKLVFSQDNYRLGRILDILALAENSVRYSSQQKIVFDANLIKAAELYTEKGPEAYISRITALEKRLENNIGNISSEQNIIKDKSIASPVLNNETQSKRFNDEKSKEPNVLVSPINAEIVESNSLNTNSSVSTSQTDETKTPIDSNSAFFSVISKAPVIDLNSNDTNVIQANSPNEVDGNNVIPITPEERNLMGRLIEKFRSTYGSFDFVYKALAEVDNYHIQENKFFITPKNNGYYSILSKDTAKKKISDVLMALGEDKFSLEVLKFKDNSDPRTTEQKEYLKDIFNGKITFNNNN